MQIRNIILYKNSDYEPRILSFKIGAVKQVIEEKKILSKVSKELRITPTMLGRSSLFDYLCI
jgi:hypothetical protein